MLSRHYFLCEILEICNKLTLLVARQGALRVTDQIAWSRRIGHAAGLIWSRSPDGDTIDVTRYLRALLLTNCSRGTESATKWPRSISSRSLEAAGLFGQFCLGAPPNLNAIDRNATNSAFKVFLDRSIAPGAKQKEWLVPIPSNGAPLLLPGDATVKKLAGATFDISEYVVDIAKRNGLAPGLKPLDGGVALHIACHARAQNMGQKAAEMLALIPGADLKVIERCSGHGGSWGVRKEHFETALKIGRPVARQAKESGKPHIASECPLAAVHILQGIERLGGEAPAEAPHPIELLARAYGA